MKRLADRLAADREEDGRIDLTSMVDVVFLLLIFFLLGTTVKPQAEIKIDLPSAQGTASSNKKKTPELLVDKKGRMFWQDKKISGTKLLVLGKDEEVVLRADKDTLNQDVVKALDLLRRSGAAGVRIEVKRK